MPGRIKHTHTPHNHPYTHQHLKPLPRLSHVRRQDPAPEAAPQPTPTPEPIQGGALFDNQAPDAKTFILNKQTIIWLVVISVVVLATLIIVTCLLCKCKRRRKTGGRHPSLEVKDGRNEFQAWNRNAPPRASVADQGGVAAPPESVRMDTWETGDSAAPLRPNAARMQNGSAMMEPVVVDYALEGKRKNSRYYSTLSSGRGPSSLWKRISQIGRAY